MEYKIFTNCMEAVKDWRKEYQKEESMWPDSRDPSIHKFLLDHMAVPQDLEKSLIVLAAWRHGKQDVYQGMSCVAKVIVNRQNDGMFRSHLTDKEQFPRMCGVGPELQTYPEKDDNFERLLTNLEDILGSKVVDLTQNARYFYYIDCNIPEWFNEIIEKGTRTVKVGSMVFYK